LEYVKKQLSVEATIDILSGLVNRRYFHALSEKYYERAKRYHQELSVLMIDIDNFKKINDTYGHHVGDDVIRSVGKILKQNNRKSDVVARYGGEEFIILLAETNVDKAEKLAEDLRIKIEKHTIESDNHHLQVAVSIGVTSFNDMNDKDLNEMIQRADKALYSAKHHGKNNVCRL